ncbi:hypothetical protein, partial [Streptomyces lavendulae]|uniref:hypothetical protein n=1 Tax=Streptomyces lavendulae TaxID=1914 RepID=UPI0036B9B926
GYCVAAARGAPAPGYRPPVLVMGGFGPPGLRGGAPHDSFGGHSHGDAAGAGGVPVAVVASLMIAIAWFTSLTGSVFVRRLDVPAAVRSGLAVAVLAVALLLSWSVTRILVRRLRSLLPDLPPPSRLDFVGLTCTIRTGSVSTTFGQAEVAAADGSTAVVQVRQHGHDDLRSGSTALLYAFDEDGEFFWVAPFDPALDPRATA